LHGDVGLLRPAVVLLNLGEGLRAWSLVPLTDGTGTHLAAIVASSADAHGALETRLLVPPAGAILAPDIVARRLAATPAAVALRALAAPEGRVQEGRAVPIPAAGTVAYVRAVFATEQRATEPLELRAVAVAAGDRLGAGGDARDAARAAARGDAEATEPSDGAMAAARAAFRSLDSAVRGADWARFGRAYAELRRALGLGPVEQP